MFFSEEDLAQNKKISDFLFHQLQLSFADVEQKKNGQQQTGEEAGAAIRQAVIQTRIESEVPTPEKLTADELGDLILQVDYPKAHLEPLKEIMYQVMTSLKVI